MQSRIAELEDVLEIDVNESKIWFRLFYRYEDDEPNVVYAEDRCIPMFDLYTAHLLALQVFSKKPQLLTEIACQNHSKN